MKTCPFCAEAVQDAAIVCKHCGRNLSGAPTVVRVDQKLGGALPLGIRYRRRVDHACVTQVLLTAAE